MRLRDRGAAPALLDSTNQAAALAKRGRHRASAALGVPSAANTSSAIAISCNTASAGNSPGKRCTKSSSALCTALPRSSGPISASSGSSVRSCRHALGIDGIGIAHPGFDVGDREFAWPRLDRRRRCRALHALRLARIAERPGERRRSRALAQARFRASRPSVSCCSRCSQRDATVGTPSDFSARVSTTRLPAASIAKSCAARPMPRSGCSRPIALRIGRENQGSAPALRGQVPSFRPPRTSVSKLCRRASSGPRMKRRG